MRNLILLALFIMMGLIMPTSGFSFSLEQRERDAITQCEAQGGRARLINGYGESSVRCRFD